MPLRLIVALNWFLGGLCLAGAVAGPLAYEHLYLQPRIRAVEETVARIAEVQRSELVARQRYLPFGGAPGAVPRAFDALHLNQAPESDFLYEAISRDGGRLDIVAVTTPEAIRDRWLPPMSYRFRLSETGAVQEAEWQAVNGDGLGLLTALTNLF